MNEQINTIEALLFHRKTPVTLAFLANWLQISVSEVEQALQQLTARYQNSAMELVEVAEGVRLQLRSQYLPALQTLSEEKPRYSRAFWEVLAFIAYHQPVTRAEIDAVRGVATGGGVYRQLFELGWVEVVGRREVVGRPELLATTRQFLLDFSLVNLQDLPPEAPLLEEM